MWWEPNNDPAAVIGDRLLQVIEATAAALWRDLHVAGETVVVRRQHNLAAAHPCPATAEQRNSPTPVRVLPARRLIFAGETREWGDQAEREVIRHRLHGVVGHLRRLPVRQHASDGALAEAEDYGIPVPDGYTFVRPHTRGAAEPGQALGQPIERRIEARGLASVMAFMR